MDAFEFDDNVIKDDISNPIPRFLCLPRIKTIFRVIEIFAIIIILISASTRLPFAFKTSGEYFRKLLNIVVSPLFIFLLSNVIVLTLFVKSRHLIFQNEHSQISVEAHLDFITNHVEDCTNFTGESSVQPKEIVFQDKGTILEVRKFSVNRRSQSMNLRRSDKVLEEDSCGKHLRRSETERRMKVEDGGAWALEAVEMVDELSTEEFQRAIDAFIARQTKFHREEKLAIVLS